MEDCKEKNAALEDKAACTVDLLEIARSYCDYNLGKCRELSTVGTMLGLILKTQRELVELLDLYD